MDGRDGRDGFAWDAKDDTLWKEVDPDESNWELEKDLLGDADIVTS